MNYDLVIAFWAVSLALAVTPGADWAYVISAGLQNRAVAPAITGLMLGYVVITAVVAAGVGAVVAAAPVLLTVMTFVGSAYLAWLGVGLIRHPPVPSTSSQEGSRWIMRGAVISGLNPKALLLFVALLPQFTSAGTPLPIPVQISVLGIVHMANSVAVYTLVGLGSGFVLRARPQASRIVGRVSGAVMIVIAIALVLDRSGLVPH